LLCQVNFRDRFLQDVRKIAARIQPGDPPRFTQVAFEREIQGQPFSAVAALGSVFAPRIRWPFARAGLDYVGFRWPRLIIGPRAA
jgi:hypothetical protein